ncbi:LysR family transcriptional regulator [Vibrio sp. SCSIO 43137]|uniref:LysR family transcriptional regulator n=1 Tax=Vibrio sp. SCSIO 43137 TaxID=3021011 RepID=UPI002307843F|nr:LysR family transcriptional regulator [Vibrio sp. SCSIO 43137]WCE32667.1 LysR family transcriptional regulator [Vibrio sp. SCSIO 43137]
MMSNVSLRQLRVFFTITQYGTLTEAAEHLALSKAAVSMALAELEKQLEHKLFDRVNNRLLLNQEGRTLLPLAEELLARSNELDSLFSQQSQWHSALKLGASETVGNQLVPKLLGELFQGSKQKMHQLLISNSATICDMLLDYQLDLALIEGKTAHPDLIAEPFCGDEMCFIVPANHPLADQQQIQLLQLDNHQWILREPGSGTREYFIHNVAAELTHWQEVMELNSTEAIINSVSAGLGIACLSVLAVDSAVKDGRVKMLRIEHPLTRDFYLLLHKDKYQSPALKKFIRLCREWCCKQGE